MVAEFTIEFMAYEEERLKGEVADFLVPVNASMVVRLGSTAFGLRRGYGGGLWFGLHLLAKLDDALVEYAPPQDDRLLSSSASMPLKTGESLRIGRMWGIQMFDAVGDEDNILHGTLEGRAWCDALSGDPYVSGLHARLRALGDFRVEVHDLSSTNGTYISVR